MTMEWHRLNNTAVINSGITAGEKWENVVLQDYSTSPTHIGNLALHLTSTLGMYNLVKAHSPEVIPVLYETSARGPGHSVYLGARPDFPGGPVQMQQELREGYHFSTDNINAAAGADLVKLARAGEAWQDGGFPLNFYGSDIYHAQNRGTLLNALVLYGTIYDDVTTSDIDLSTVVTKLNLSAADGQLVAGLADGVLGSEPFGPGDYNEDGDVNQLDLEDWGGQFGQSEPEMGADGNGDGKVDGADMLAWQRIASREAAGAAAASVATPEPGGSWLLVVGAGVGFMVARDAGVGAYVQRVGRTGDAIAGFIERGAGLLAWGVNRGCPVRRFPHNHPLFVGICAADGLLLAAGRAARVPSPRRRDRANSTSPPQATGGTRIGLSISWPGRGTKESV